MRTEPAQGFDRAMRSLYIHCGLARTGTTSLQRYFANQRETLRGRGFDYPEIGLNPSGIAHHVIADEILLHTRSNTDMSATNRLLDYLGGSDRTENIVLSSEGFVNCLCNLKARDQFLDFLKSCMRSNDRVFVVFASRILSQFFDSWYIQRLKIGTVGSDINSYLQKSIRWTQDFFDGIVLLQDLLGPDGVVLFDVSLGGRDSVAEFLSVLKISDLPGAGTAQRHNERLGLKKAGIMYRLLEKQLSGSLDPKGAIVPLRRAIVRSADFPDETYQYRVIPYAAANTMQDRARKRVPSRLADLLGSTLRDEPDHYEAVSLSKVAISEEDVKWLRQSLPAALGSSSLLDGMVSPA